MIDKILKDIKGLFKVQDKAKFLKQNISYLVFFLCRRYLFSSCTSLYRWRCDRQNLSRNIGA